MAHQPLGLPEVTPGGSLTGPRAPFPEQPSRDMRWWTQIMWIALFYALYTGVRDLRGTRPVSAVQALHNADKVIGFERLLGVFDEQRIQHAVLGQRWLISFLDDWYGSTHFVVTAAVLAILFFAYRDRYRLWRNALAVVTGLALAGFALFPMMPPRLLPPRYGFIDTLQTVGGLWNFDSGPMPHLSDQFAAMPSLHFAWALWSGLALFATFRRAWTRLLALCYPAVTLVCVVVTANHFFADTAAGAFTVLIGYSAARSFERRSRAGRDGVEPGMPVPAVAAAEAGLVADRAVERAGR